MFVSRPNFYPTPIGLFCFSRVELGVVDLGVGVKIGATEVLGHFCDKQGELKFWYLL